MLNKDRHKRLGAKRDVKELMEHPFFATIDFDLLLQKKLPVPYVPKIVGFSPKCLPNFIRFL